MARWRPPEPTNAGVRSIDPKSGLWACGLRSATVTGPELDLADALSTGLFAAGEAGLEWIDSSADYEALVVREDGMLLATPGFANAQRADL